MLERIFPFMDSDDPQRLARTAAVLAVKQPVLRGLETLCNAIEAAFTRIQDIDDRLRLVDSMEEAASELLERLKRELVHAVGNPVRFGLLHRRASTLVNHLQHTYQSAMTLASGSNGNAYLPGALLWAIERQLLEQLGDIRSERLLWRPLLAQLREVHKDKPGETYLSLNRLSLDSQSTLGRLILFCMLQDQGLDDRQLLLADRLLRFLAAGVSFNTRYETDTPFVLNPLATGKPQWISAWDMPELDGHALFCGFNRINPIYDAMIDQLVQEEALLNEWVVASDQSTTETLALLGMIARAVTTPSASRLAQRRRGDGLVRIAFECMLIRGLLAQPHKRKPAREALIRDAEIYDVSTAGWGLIVEANSPCARLGGLVAIYDEDHNGWALGVIRRLRTGRDGRIHLGVQLLSRNAEAARLSFRDASINGSDREHIIYLPKAAGCSGAGIITGTPLLNPGQHYALDVSRRDLSITINRYAEAGNDFVLYDGVVQAVVT